MEVFYLVDSYIGKEGIVINTVDELEIEIKKSIQILKVK